MRFVDTNVLLYAISTDDREVRQREIARDLLKSEDLGLSVQVLQEFYVQATRASRADALTHEQAVNLIEAWLRYPVQENTVGVMQAALNASSRWNVSYWDAAIIEAARAMGCSTLLSEDLQHDMNFAGVRVVNPFQ